MGNGDQTATVTQDGGAAQYEASYDTTVQGCNVCGAVVWDQAAHNAWHGLPGLAGPMRFTGKTN